MGTQPRYKLTIGLVAVSVGILILSADSFLKADDAPATEGRQFDLRTLPVSAQARLQRNPVIDCSTNPAYRKGEYRDYVASIDQTNHINTTTDCRTCHQSRRPTVGVGDRPVTSFATFALANYSKDPQKYSIYAGEDGQGEWVDYEIEPGKLQRFSWRYSNPSDPRSPAYWVAHGGTLHRVEPLATPNKDIGSLYYFAASRGDATVRMSKASDQPYRAAR